MRRYPAKAGEPLPRPASMLETPLKIAFAAEGTRGDIYPLISLAGEFRARGHDVVVCAPPNFREATTSQGLAFGSVGQDVRLYLETEAQALHGSAIAMARAADKLFQQNIGPQFSDLNEAAAGCDMIIAAGTQVASASIAERLGVPYRFIAYDPILFPSGEHPSFLIKNPKLPRSLNRLSWWAQKHVIALGMRKQVNLQRQRLGLGPIRDVYGTTLGTNPILATEARLAPAPADFQSVETLGCLHPFDDSPLPDKLEDFLSAGPPPIYIGFGSMTDPNPNHATGMFLDAAHQAGLRVVLSQGWAGLGESALSSDVCVVGAVNHAALFQRVSLVVHHGGAGTTTTAARAGSPQVLLPHVLDQFHWAYRVQRLGLGPPAIPRKRVNANVLAETLTASVENEWLTERAQQLGEQLRQDLSQRPSPVDTIL